MARPHALAGALMLLLALAVPATSPAKPQPSAFSARCEKVHTSSFHGHRCPKGSGHSQQPATAHDLLFTAHDGHCRDANLAPTASDLPAVRAATLCLVNRERTSRGERALRWNDRLISAAQRHTESMAFGDYFGHDGPSGQTPLARLRNTGYISTNRVGFEIGENIGWGSRRLGTPRAIVAAWMASPAHRANILDHRFRDTGIGISAHLGPLAHGQRGGMYTQDFGVIIP
jgi:uncharacterized protein YkwD